jgi:hypothetical protein
MATGNDAEKKKQSKALCLVFILPPKLISTALVQFHAGTLKMDFTVRLYF